MDNLEKKLLELREALEKALAMPSIKGPKMPLPPMAEMSPAISKQPSLIPDSKKNPVKVAQQVEDPNAKAQALKMAKEKLKLAKNGQWRLEEDPVEKGIKSTLAGAALAGATLLNPGKAAAQSHTQMQAPDKTAYASIEHTPTDESTLNTRTFGPYKVTTMLEPRSNIAGQQEHKSSALTHHVELVGKDHSLEHAKILTAELKGSGIEPSHVLGLKPGDSYVSNKTFKGTASASKGVASFPWNRVDR